MAASPDNLARLSINAADLPDELTVCDDTACGRIELCARRHRQLRAEFSDRFSTHCGDSYRRYLPLNPDLG